MARAFLWTAVSEVLLFLATGALGLVAADAAGLRRHVGAALFTAIFGCMMHAVVLTYFAVTGKLIHQAVALGKLSVEPFERLRRSKKRITLLVGLGMLSIAVAVGTGAWRLSGTQGPRWHLLAAGAAVLVNCVVFYHQYTLIFEAQQSLGEVMREYESARSGGGRASQSPV